MQLTFNILKGESDYPHSKQTWSDEKPRQGKLQYIQRPTQLSLYFFFPLGLDLLLEEIKGKLAEAFLPLFRNSYEGTRKQLNLTFTEYFEVFALA